MRNVALSGIAALAVPMAILGASLPETRAATLQQCAQNHVVCNGQCASTYNPMLPERTQHCMANCGIARGQCDVTASDRSAAPPPAGQTKRAPHAVAPGVKPSLLERDASPAGTSPAPAGRPAGGPGAGGPQLR
jgi:hypothetical protein